MIRVGQAIVFNYFISKMRVTMVTPGAGSSRSVLPEGSDAASSLPRASELFLPSPLGWAT